GGDGGRGAGNADAARGPQPAIGVAGGVAGDGIALDDDARHAALREVVRRGHAHDAAAHDHHVAAGHARGPFLLQVAPILSERARQVKPAITPVTSAGPRPSQTLSLPSWTTSVVRAYWITWSGRCKTDGGIVSPMAFAVLRLTTSSNSVGCSTGRSAGFAPFRILLT